MKLRKLSTEKHEIPTVAITTFNTVEIYKWNAWS